MSLCINVIGVLAPSPLSGVLALLAFVILSPGIGIVFSLGSPIYSTVKDRPLVIRHLESLDVELISSVHTPGRNVLLILGDIDRFAPRFVAIELTDSSRKTVAMDVDVVNERYHDRLVCIDRSPEITSSRYLCGTPPFLYLEECLNRYVWLPFNHASILTFNYLYRLYRVLPGDNFYTFGWSREDTRRYIFEWDEYMAGRLLDRIKERRALGHRDGYAVVVGRASRGRDGRHPGGLCRHW
jgi:hypothetical protein